MAVNWISIKTGPSLEGGDEHWYRCGRCRELGPVYLTRSVAERSADRHALNCPRRNDR